MRGLVPLSLANLRSFLRDRPAVFWTLAFPILFVVLFGTIFTGGGTASFDVGWVDQDASAGSRQLRTSFEQTGILTLQDGTLEDEKAAMERGDVDAVIVVPPSVGSALSPRGGTGAGGAGSPVREPGPSRATPPQGVGPIA